MNIFILILLTFYSPLVHFSGGRECKDPSHFLFSDFVYWILFHLLLPYNLDVPSCSTNRQRYCSAWPKRDWILYIFLNNLFLPLGEICCLNSHYLCIGWMGAQSSHIPSNAHIYWAREGSKQLLWPWISLRNQARIVEFCFKIDNFDHWSIEASELVDLMIDLARRDEKYLVLPRL